MYLYLSRHDATVVSIRLRVKRCKVLKKKWKSLLYIYFILFVLTCVLFFLINQQKSKNNNLGQTIMTWSSLQLILFKMCFRFLLIALTLYLIPLDKAQYIKQYNSNGVININKKNRKQFIPDNKRMRVSEDLIIVFNTLYAAKKYLCFNLQQTVCM